MKNLLLLSQFFKWSSFVVIIVVIFVTIDILYYFIVIIVIIFSVPLVPKWLLEALSINGTTCVSWHWLMTEELTDREQQTQ